jgi:membrane-associated phospholipid phosphatase
MRDIYKMNKYLSDVGYQGPNILLILILLTFAKQDITNPYVYAVVIAWQFSSHLLNVFIKNTLRAPRPDSAQDPQFANLKPTLKNYLSIHKHYGMPSGHAQAMFSQLIFIALYFRNHWLTGIAFGQTLLTLWQRYETRRHSFKQLVAGSLLGTLVGFIFLKIFKRAFCIADADMITVL